ncbi:hypothetical protein Agub_g5652, partial [Astrephomene gubernaculifera]
MQRTVNVSRSADHSKRGAVRDQLCVWFLLSISWLGQAMAQIWVPIDRQVCWAERSRQLAQQQVHDQEQCLCSIPEYAYFYSRAFGRSSCNVTFNRRSLAYLPASTQPQHSRQLQPSTLGMDNRILASSSCPDPVQHTDKPPPSTTTSSSSSTTHISPNGPASMANTDNAKDAHQLLDSNQQRLIVRFKQYAPADSHHTFLRDLLGPEGPDAWSWLPRSNAASRFPTDFGLLATSPAVEPFLRGRLQAAAGVRDVHFDKRYTGKLAWVPEGRLRELVLSDQANPVMEAVGGRRSGSGAGIRGSGSEPGTEAFRSGSGAGSAETAAAGGRSAGSKGSGSSTAGDLAEQGAGRTRRGPHAAEQTTADAS